MLLVSHDRAFLNDVVTSTLAIEADGTVKEYDGGYDDYLRQRSVETAGGIEVFDQDRQSADLLRRPKSGRS